MPPLLLQEDGYYFALLRPPLENADLRGETTAPNNSPEQELHVMKSSSSPTPATMVFASLTLLLGLGASFSFNAVVRVFNNRGEGWQVTSRSGEQSSIEFTRGVANPKSEIADRGISTRRNYLRRNLQLTDDRFDEVFELSVTHIPETKWPPTMSPSSVAEQPQEQSNSPTAEYSYSPSSSSMSSLMKHSSQPPSMTGVQSVEPSNPPHVSSSQAIESSAHPSIHNIPSGRPSLGRRLSTSPSSHPSSHSSESVHTKSCPPAYDPSIAVTYKEGSEVEVNGTIYRCNPYPFAIYCTLHGYRPESLDNISWKYSWEVTSACAVPPSGLSLWPSLSTTAAPTGAPITQVPTKKPTPHSTLLPSMSPSSRPWMQPSSLPTNMPLTQLTSKPIMAPSSHPTFKPSHILAKKPTPQPTLLPSISPSSRPWAQPSGRPSKIPSMQPTSHPTSVPSTSSPTFTPSKSPSLSRQPSSMLSRQPSMSTSPSGQSSMSPTKNVVQNLEQSSIPTTISLSSSNLTFGLSICPPAYDQTSAFSYVWGSTVEMNGFIYMCNSYPYEIYCTIPSYQPQSENQLWVDVWAEVAPCKIDESSTIKPSLKPSSVSSTSSKSESWGGAKFSLPTYSPTKSTTNASASIPSHSTNVPPYFPTSPPSQNATKYFPTFSPTSKQPTNANAKAPTYSPITSAAFNGSDTEKSADHILLEQTTTNSVQDGKKMLWASLAISVVVIFCAAAVLHRNRRFPETKILLKFSKDEETFRELPWGYDSGSMGAQIESGLPSAVFIPDAKPNRHPNAFNQNTRFELVPPSLISRARSNEPVPSQCVGSPTSMICFPESISNEKRDVIAPPGKLGIILKQSLYGCMIQSVKHESPLLGILFPEDLILSFNDVDVLEFNARHLTQLIAENIKSEMRFTVISKGDPVLRTLNSHNLPNQRPCTYQFNAVPSRRTPSSMICLPESSFNTKRDVMAPPGKLGIILKQSLYGCMIQSVKPESPMLGILFPEDLILSFNDVDVLEFNTRHISQLIAENFNKEKKFTVIANVMQSFIP